VQPEPQAQAEAPADPAKRKRTKTKVPVKEEPDVVKQDDVELPGSPMSISF
jgi:DNA-directed RNA polymerase III subunit RPC2